MLLSRGVEDAKKNTGIKSRQKKNKGAKKGSIKDTQSTKKQHFSRAKKKLCLDDRDTNSPLDKDRDTMPGPEERSSRPGQ